MWTDIQMKRYLGRYQRSSVPMKSEAHQGSMSRWLSGKESACSSGDVSSIPGSGRSPWRNWQLMPAFLPGKSRGQRSLMGYSPWGCRVRYNWVTEHMHSSYILNSRKRIPLRQTWWSFSSPFPHRLLSELLPAVVMEAAGLPLARTNFLLHWTKQAWD